MKPKVPHIWSVALFLLALWIPFNALAAQPVIGLDSKNSQGTLLKPVATVAKDSSAARNTSIAKALPGTVSTSVNKANPAKTPSDSIRVVKHSFNHRQQIITGSVVMACLALIMVTMNNYNPR